MDRDKRRGTSFKDETKGKSLEIERETVRFTCWSTRRVRAREGKNGGAVREGGEAGQKVWVGVYKRKGTVRDKDEV